MSDKFIKVQTNEPDGEIVILISRIILERTRLNGTVIYKLVIGPKDSRPISQNTYNELKVKLLEGPSIPVEIKPNLESVKKTVEIIPDLKPDVKHPPKPFSNHFRKPTINMAGIPTKIKR